MINFDSVLILVGRLFHDATIFVLIICPWWPFCTGWMRFRFACDLVTGPEALGWMFPWKVFQAASDKSRSRRLQIEGIFNDFLKWVKSIFPYRGRPRTARNAEFEAVCSLEISISFKRGRKARALDNKVPWVHAKNSFFRSFKEKCRPSSRIRPAEARSLLQRLSTWRLHFRFCWMVRPKNLMDLLGYMVSPFMRMGFGSNPKPMTSLF